jgi:hypothetical protein
VLVILAAWHPYRLAEAQSIIQHIDIWPFAVAPEGLVSIRIQLALLVFVKVKNDYVTNVEEEAMI